MAQQRAQLPPEQTGIVENDEMLTPHIKLRVAYGVMLLCGILAVGTLFYMYMEKWSWVDALYFSASTITTVGYGDLTPHSDASKLFTVAYMFIGVGSALYVLSTIAAEFIKRREVEWLRAAQRRSAKVRPIRTLGSLGRSLTRAAVRKLRYDSDEIADGYYANNGRRRSRRR